MADLYQESKKEQWTTIIRPPKGWLDFNLYQNLRELLRYWDLIMLFVRRDFVAYYKQTILGPLWFMIQPVLTTLVFTVVFGRIADISTDGVPHVLFYMSGIIMWNYFSGCLTKTADTFISNAPIFGKVYFPRLAVPVSLVITTVLTFLIQFMLFLLMMIYFYFKGMIELPNLWVLATPMLIIHMAALGMGVGILIASLTTKYRDMVFLINFGVQLWMYATPVAYPISQVPQHLQWWFWLNPMSAIISTFRYAFLGAGSLDLYGLLISGGMTVLILLIGIMLFTRIEKSFMDTV